MSLGGLELAGLSLGGLFFSSFVIGLSGAVMPGPILTVTIKHTTRQGIKAGPLVALGHCSLEVVLLLALAAGLGPFLTRPLVSGVIGVLGAGILFWMARGMLHSLPGLRVDLSDEAKGQASPFRDGIILSLANPYWTIWWATVGLSFMAVAMESGYGWLGLAAFFLGHISSDFAWFSLISTVVSKTKNFITDKVLRWVVGVCAVFLIVFSLYFAWFACEKLRGCF
ncbi:LysE family translocator [Dethiosulfatarculus sandiegensis]|uniref:Lysine transporter LysE n=1 Tax=Dethiosulfatarculus sandiegensis TaxID=1429043 RepID=A0A0D2JV09_9BACT|nr:LysE family transporter [Dethiosulfatarculus sandiegensis]KIX13385.1 lysine transporter LysE [Dethiosulfatarculus sandiegensis]